MRHHFVLRYALQRRLQPCRRVHAGIRLRLGLRRKRTRTERGWCPRRRTTGPTSAGPDGATGPRNPRPSTSRYPWCFWRSGRDLNPDSAIRDWQSSRVTAVTTQVCAMPVSRLVLFRPSCSRVAWQPRGSRIRVIYGAPGWLKTEFKFTGLVVPGPNQGLRSKGEWAGW